MISGRPRSWATSASAAMSATSPDGFATISANTQLGAVGDRGARSVRVVAGHERRVDPEAAQRHVELGDRAAVERGRGDDVVAGAREGGERQELRGLPAELVATAPSAPSRLARRSSSAATVGFAMRL